MKVGAFALLALAAADGSPCLCIFDVDSTLVGWAKPEQCPKDQNHDLPDAGYSMLRADAMLHLSDTFCKECYIGVISAGSAGGKGSDERADIVAFLQKGGKLPTSTWNQGGCKQKKKGSPLITDCSDKPSAVPGIMQWYEDKEGVSIANKDVHFYDDQDYNIITFEGTGYNVHQVSCPSDGPASHTQTTKCGATVGEINNSSGISYCCSGSQAPAPEKSSTCVNACGVPCHFPFTYNGKSYHACTTAGGDPAPWCSTKPEYDGKNYGYCYGCPSEVGRTNATTPGVIV